MFRELLYNSYIKYTILYYYMQYILALRLEETGLLNEDGGLIFSLLINETDEKEVQDTSCVGSGVPPS